MLDQTKGDLWVVPLGTKSFDDPSLLDGREKHAVLSTPGVASVEELVVGFVNWRKPQGRHDGGAAGRLRHQHAAARCPGTSSQGSIADLAAPLCGGGRSAPTSRSSASSRLGDRAEINDMRGDGHAVTTASAPSPRCPTSSPRWHWRARCSMRRPTRPPTRSCTSRPAPTSSSVRKRLPAAPAGRRGPHPAGVPQAQPRLLAVRDRRRRGADRRRGARHHRRHRHRRPDALRQHQGPPERVRHLARARRLGRLHPQGHPDAGGAERLIGYMPRHGAEPGRDLGLAATPRC